MNVLHFMMVIGILKKEYKMIDGCSPIPPATSTSTSTPAQCSFRSMLTTQNFPANTVVSCLPTLNCGAGPCDCTLQSGQTATISSCPVNPAVCVIVQGVSTLVDLPVAGSPLMCENGVLTIANNVVIDPNSLITCAPLGGC